MFSLINSVHKNKKKMFMTVHWVSQLSQQI